MLRPGEGRRIRALTSLVTCKLESRETGGAFSLFEVESEPGTGPIPHTHSFEDEVFIVLEGEVEITVAGRTHRLGPGAIAYGPRGIEHRFEACGERSLRMLVLTAPGGFERFFDATAELFPGGEMTDGAAYERVVRAFGMTPGV